MNKIFLHLIMANILFREKENGKETENSRPFTNKQNQVSDSIKAGFSLSIILLVIIFIFTFLKLTA